MAAWQPKYEWTELLDRLGIKFKCAELRRGFDKGRSYATLTDLVTRRHWTGRGHNLRDAELNLIFEMERDLQPAPVSTTDPAIYEWI